MKRNSSLSKKISIFFYVVIVAMLIISLVALFQAAAAYAENEFLDFQSILLGVSGFALSVYIMAVMRRKPVKLGFEIPKVLTTLQCTGCDFKNARNFERGDYVLKEAGECPKCKGSLIVASIYREVEKEEKEE